MAQIPAPGQHHIPSIFRHILNEQYGEWVAEFRSTEGMFTLSFLYA